MITVAAVIQSRRARAFLTAGRLGSHMPRDVIAHEETVPAPNLRTAVLSQCGGSRVGLALRKMGLHDLEDSSLKRLGILRITEGQRPHVDRLALLVADQVTLLIQERTTRKHDPPTAIGALAHGDAVDPQAQFLDRDPGEALQGPSKARRPSVEADGEAPFAGGGGRSLLGRRSVAGVSALPGVRSSVGPWRAMLAGASGSRLGDARRAWTQTVLRVVEVWNSGIRAIRQTIAATRVEPNALPAQRWRGRGHARLLSSAPV